MPNETGGNTGGAGGDDAAAKAAADKAAADAAAAAAAAGAGNGKGGGDGEETITMKKSDLKKIEEDRDNYKEGLLRKKADERNLGGDGTGRGGDAGAGNVIDEKKIKETVTAATNSALRAAGEKTAKRAFLTAHPEYVDDTQWTALMSNLSFKGGEVTHEDVLDRMEAALFEHKRSTGKLDDHLRAEHERGIREGRIQGELGSGYGAGGSGDRGGTGKEAGSLSPKGIEMARAMHTDPEKAKKMDPSKDNVIDITKV